MNPHGTLIEKSRCQLLLVDIQKVLLDPCLNTERLVRHVKALLEVVKILEIPVTLSVHNPQGLGPFLPELTQKAAGARVLSKLEFSCLKNESLRTALEESGRKTLILAGLETHICIFQTAIHALSEGYTVHVVSDAVTSRSPSNQETGLGRMERAGAVVTSTEMVIFELLGEAGTPEFRAALPTLKSL